MVYSKSKTRALLTIAAGASSALLACTSSSALGDIAPAPDAGEDANGGSCTGTNGCTGLVAHPDADVDADVDATVEGCDACGIVALPPDSSPDADDAGDASETSTDAADDAQVK